MDVITISKLKEKQTENVRRMGEGSAGSGKKRNCLSVFSCHAT